MGQAYFQADTIVRIADERYRIMMKFDDSCWQFQNLRTKQIRDYEVAQIERMRQDGSLTFVSNGDVTHCGKVNSNISPKDMEVAKLRLTYVREVLDIPNTQDRMTETIAQVWEKVRLPSQAPAFGSVYQWKRRYLQAGNDIRALIDRTSKKGNREPRCRKEVIAIAKESISSIYLRRQGNSIEATLTDAIMKVRRANEERLASDAIQQPTRRLISRLLKDIPAFDKEAARRGHEAARKKYRSVKGHRTTDGPLERAEIDHTHLDLFVIDDRTNQPLGRPYLTACIDDYSRCILGAYIGFTPPGYLSVAKCLKECFLPKNWISETYANVCNDWPAYGLMRELVIDNGVEFHSHSLEQMCLSLGIEMHFAPRREPWFKGKIERFFGTLNRQISHAAPGTTFANIFEKGDYDPAKHAVITFSELKKIIYKWVADVYHQETHRSLQTTPVNMWKSHIRFEDIRHPDDSTQLDAVMGTVHQRRLTHKGIEFEGLLYYSPELDELRHEKGDTLDVELRVDEDDISSIYVIWNKSRLYQVPAIKREYVADGISLWQHRVYKNYTSRFLDNKQDRDALLDAKRDVARMIEESLQQKSSRSRKRVARHLESSRSNAEKYAKAEKREVDQRQALDLRIEKSDMREAVSENASYEGGEYPLSQKLKFQAIKRKRN
jgi:putative transposase